MKKNTASVFLYPTQENDKKSIHLTQILCKTIVSCSMIGLLMNKKAGSSSQIVVLLLTAIIFFLLTLLESDKKKYQMLQFIIGGSCFFLFILDVRGFLNGVITIINEWITCWNNNFSQYHGLLQVTDLTLWQEIKIWLIFSLLFVLLVSWIMHNSYQNFFMLLIGIILIASFLTGTALSFFVIAIIVTAGIVKSFLFAGSKANVGKIMIFGMFSLAVLLILFIGCSSYENLESVSRMKQNIKQNVHKFRYGEDNLPKGNLYLADDLLREEGKTLQVSVDIESKLYLKGYVGAEYTGESWEELSGKYYTGENSGMLTWLESQNFFPLFQFAEYASLRNQYIDTDNISLIKLNVDNVGADRQYLYLPNTAVLSEELKESSGYDWQVRSTKFLGNRSYSAAAYASEDVENLELEKQFSLSNEVPIQSYLKSENIYHFFTQSAYLDINEETKKMINDIFFSTADIDLKKDSVTTITSRIRTILKAKISYVEIPSHLPEKEDYLSWLLTKENKGNSVAFASAAVMAYRSAGIPARYVEGYYLSDENAKKSKESNNFVMLTKKEGHAWVEIYLEPAGWVVVEVTPGFYKNPESTDTLLELSNDTAKGQAQDKEYHVIEQYDNSTQGETKKDTPQKSLSIAGIILGIIILGCIFIFIFLELQRAIRMNRRKKQLSQKEINELVKYYYDAMCLLFSAAGIEGSTTMPYRLEEQIIQKVPQITKPELDRAFSLIQKVIFGEQNLRPHELRAISRVYQILYQNIKKARNPWIFLKNRYGYCL